MSKTFDNYVRARERAENIAKVKIDHMNDMALKKIKNQRKAERCIKDMNSSNKAKLDTQKGR